MKGLLVNCGNSCYMDVCLMSLLTCDDDDLFISRTILNGSTKYPKIQKRVKKLQEKLNNETKKVITCSNLRRSFSSKKHIENFSDSNIKDSGEFVSYFLDAFPDTKTCSTKTTRYVSAIPNGEILEFNTTRSSKEDSILFVNVENLYRIRSTCDCKTIETTTVHENKCFSEIIRVVDCDRLILQFQRLNPFTEQMIDKSIEISEFINLENEDEDEDANDTNTTILKIYAITVYVSMHYMSFLSRNGIWYFYNDLSEELAEIGTFKDVITNFKDTVIDPMKYGTEYYYQKVNES